MTALGDFILVQLRGRSMLDFLVLALAHDLRCGSDVLGGHCWFGKSSQKVAARQRLGISRPIDIGPVMCAASRDFFLRDGVGGGEASTAEDSSLIPR